MNKIMISVKHLFAALGNALLSDEDFVFLDISNDRVDVCMENQENESSGFCGLSYGSSPILTSEPQTLKFRCEADDAAPIAFSFSDVEVFLSLLSFALSEIDDELSSAVGDRSKELSRDKEELLFLKTRIDNFLTSFGYTLHE